MRQGQCEQVGSAKVKQALCKRLLPDQLQAAAVNAMQCITTPCCAQRPYRPPTHLQAHSGGDGGVGQARHEPRDADLGEHGKGGEDAQRLHHHRVGFALRSKVGQQQRVAAQAREVALQCQRGGGRSRGRRGGEGVCEGGVLQGDLRASLPACPCECQRIPVHADGASTAVQTASQCCHTLPLTSQDRTARAAALPPDRLAAFLSSWGRNRKMKGSVEAPTSQSVSSPQPRVPVLHTVAEEAEGTGCG